MTRKKIKSKVWSAGCIFVRPLWRPKDKKIAIINIKNYQEFYFQFLVIKTLDPDGIEPKNLYQDPESNESGSETLTKDNGSMHLTQYRKCV